MWSYGDQKNQFQIMSQMDDPEALTLGYKNINMGIKKLEIMLGMPPLEEERTYSTLTSTISYPLPNRFIRLIELYVTNGTMRYYAEPVYNDADWGVYQRQSSITGDQLRKVFVRPGLHTFEVFPKFATASLTMTMVYESFTKDLSADDYTTGTITTLANGGTEVTGSGTTFTEAMAGRWFKTDDGEWYRIGGYTSATAITLQMPYQGTAIAAGSSTFKIGEITRLPEGTHELPVEYALWQHFSGPRRDDAKALVHKNNWLEGIKWAKQEFGSRYASAIIPSQRYIQKAVFRDSNDYPDLSSA